jgi:hypothetical protein
MEQNWWLRHPPVGGRHAAIVLVHQKVQGYLELQVIALTVTSAGS